MSGPPLLEARSLRVVYAPPRRWPAPAAPAVTAVDGVDLLLQAGGRLAVVGESGSGKSTLARALLRLLPLDDGQVLLRGEDLAVLTPDELRQRRRGMQMVFQDPYGSLDPRMSIADIVAEPLAFGADRVAGRSARRDRAREMLAAVGLPASLGERRPREVSGGQAQRVAIARALICEPSILICDEPVSALDLDTRGQVLRLLQSQAEQRRLALLFISHDLSAVRWLCDHVLVMYRGRVVESAPADELFAYPRHPYTRALLAAVPVPDPVRARQRTAAMRSSLESS